jgi:aldose 1-epimerase
MGAASSSTAPALERLECGDSVAEIAPATGGALAAFYSRATPGRPRHDWLRNGSAAALAGADAFELASFPLVPWCNRIRDGRFEWNGRVVQLAPNRPGSPHTIHGIGWSRPWRVTGRDTGWIELAFEDDGRGDWPFPFAATQRYTLDAEGLVIALALRNTGTESLPGGLGHHPYLPHRREGTGTCLTAAVDAIWLGDAEVLPTALSTTHPVLAALRSGTRIDRFALDNNFTGFGHQARVAWPDGSTLTLEGEAPLDFFVLYSPSDRDVFVIEAVSNCTDWMNLRRAPRAEPAAHVGGTGLAPGATLGCVTRLRPMRA